MRPKTQQLLSKKKNDKWVSKFVMIMSYGRCIQGIFCWYLDLKQVINSS